MFWINGKFQKATDALDIADRGFLLGDGVFETLLVRNGIGVFLDEHLARLRIGLEALKMPMSKLPDLDFIIARLANEAPFDGDGVARLTISRGVSGRGLAFEPADKSAVTIMVTLQPYMKPTSIPISVEISSHHRSEKSIAAKHKTLNYLDNILARNEATENGIDEAIMLNNHGRVACASIANIFVVDKNSTISTPPLVEGALAGIVRRKILDAGARLGLVIREASLDVKNLENDFVFLTNSLIGIRHAVLVGGDNRKSNPGALKTFQRLQSWYEHCLCEDIAMKARNS